MSNPFSMTATHPYLNDDDDDYEFELDDKQFDKARFVMNNYTANYRYSQHVIEGDDIMTSNERKIAYTISAYDPDEQHFADQMRFTDAFKGNIYTTEIKFSAKTSLLEILDSVREMIADVGLSVRYDFYTSNIVNIYGSIKDYDYGNDVWKDHEDKVFLRIQDTYRQVDPGETSDREFSIRLTGDRSAIQKLYAALVPYTKVKKRPRVTWYYSSGGRMSMRPIILPEPKPSYSEFYPWIGKDLDTYISDYLKSDAPIMLLLGEPGTGKTSFIRNMIYKNGLNTAVTYDEALLESDAFFVNYLTDDDTDLLVVEDADLLLTSRESAGNKVMSKLLNVSDGLIKVLHKKIIFTANITQVSKVDDALLRPGRCYGTQSFRPLDYDEAVRAAEIAGINAPVEDRPHTLAQLFNPEEKRAGGNAPEMIRMGFR